MDDTSAYKILIAAFASLLKEQPADHGDKSRRYAIMITDLEKIIAYYQIYILMARLHQGETGE